MTLIDPRNGPISYGPVQGRGVLRMVPLLRKLPTRADADPLPDALAAGSLAITELASGAGARDVAVENRGSRPVLLVEGTTLVGARQDRILNRTLLVPPGSLCHAPVSAIGELRPGPAGGTFELGAAKHFSAARALALGAVNAALAAGGEARPPQEDVSGDLAGYRRRAGHPTFAWEDLCAAYAAEAEALTEGLMPLKHQVGAVFVTGGTFLGLDLYDTAAAFAAEFPALVQSYAIEVVGVRALEVSEEVAVAFAESIATSAFDSLAVPGWTTGEGLGLGTELRLSSEHLLASALEYRGELVHLGAFPNRRRRRDAPPAKAQMH
jgi:hypothetical protein